MDSNWTEVMNSTSRGISSPPEDSLVFLLGLLNLGAVTCYSIFNFLFRSETTSLDTREFINRKVQSTLDELVLNVHMSTYYNSALQAAEDEEDDEEEESRAHSRRNGRKWISFFDLPNNSEVAKPSRNLSSRTGKMLKINSSALGEEFNAFVQSSQNKLTNDLIEFLGSTHLGRPKRSTPKRGTKAGRKSNRTRILRRRKPAKSTSVTVTTSKPVSSSSPFSTPQEETREVQELKTQKEDEAKQIYESLIFKAQDGQNVQELQVLNEEGRAIDNTAQIVMQSSMSFDPSTQRRVSAVGNSYPAPALPAFARHPTYTPNGGSMQALPTFQYIQGLTSRTGEASPTPGISKGPASLNSSPPIVAPVPRSVIGRLIHLIQQTTPLTMDLLSIYNEDHQIGRQVDKKCTENLICETNRQWKRAGNVEAALAPFLSIALSWWSKRNPSNPTYYQAALPQALMATRAGWMGNNCQDLYPTTQECRPGAKWILSRTRFLPLVSHNPHPVQTHPPQWQPQPPRTWVTERPQPLRRTPANKDDDEEPKLEEKQDEEEEDEDESVSSEDYSGSKDHEERIPTLITPTPVPAPVLHNKPVFQKLPTNWDRRDPGKPAPTVTPTQKQDGKPNLQTQHLPNSPPNINTNNTKPLPPKPSPRIRPDLSNVAPVLGLPRNRDILAQPLSKPELSKPQKVSTTTEKNDDEDVSYVESFEEEEDSSDSPSEIKKRVNQGLAKVEVTPHASKNQNLPNVKKSAQEQQQNQQRQQQQQTKQTQQQQQKKVPNKDMVNHEKKNTNESKANMTQVSPEPFQPWMGTPMWAGQAGGSGGTFASSSIFPPSDWVDQDNSGQEERRVPQVFTIDDAVLDSKRQQMIMQYIRDRSVRPRRM